MKRSGLSLVFAGLLGGLFFWATDPRYGVVKHLGLLKENVVDAANQAWPGTLVGLVGSGLALLLGLWLLTRRTT